MATLLPHVNSVKEKALQTFAEKFGEQAAVCVYAPGRVNLIGEHTDYNDGFVLPMVNLGKSFASHTKHSRFFTRSLLFALKSHVFYFVLNRA